MMLSHDDCKLYTANIGDSGFLVVRHGKVVHRSQEQQHYFNTPFQVQQSLPSVQAIVMFIVFCTNMFCFACCEIYISSKHL